MTQTKQWPQGNEPVNFGDILTPLVLDKAYLLRERQPDGSLVDVAWLDDRMHMSGRLRAGDDLQAPMVMDEYIVPEDGGLLLSRRYGYA